MSEFIQRALYSSLNINPGTTTIKAGTGWLLSAVVLTSGPQVTFYDSATPAGTGQAVAMAPIASGAAVGSVLDFRNGFPYDFGLTVVVGAGGSISVAYI